MDYVDEAEKVEIDPVSIEQELQDIEDNIEDLALRIESGEFRKEGRGMIRSCKQIQKEFRRLRREKAASIDYAVVCSIYSSYYLDECTLDIVPRRIFNNFLEHLKIYKELYNLEVEHKMGY